MIETKKMGKERKSGNGERERAKKHSGRDIRRVMRKEDRQRRRVSE